MGAGLKRRESRRGETQQTSLKRSGSSQILQLSHLRKLRECEKVAAVCYRVHDGCIEFLLVRTGSDHWTFPKGSVEPGLTHAQAAALEAYEEAGVHGRIEETSFARYLLRKRSRPSAGVAGKKLAIHAHLCEVLRLGRPQEPGRDPTWFSAGKAKRRLREDRASSDGTEMARIIDRAERRILRMLRTIRSVAAVPQSEGLRNDALQKVRFEAAEMASGHHQMLGASFSRYVHGSLGGIEHSAAIALAVRTQIYEALQLAPQQETNEDQLPQLEAAENYRVPQLGNGATLDAPKVTQIDSVRGTLRKTRVATGKVKN